MSGANRTSTQTTFNRSSSASLTGTLLFFAGLGCLGIAAIGFGVAIFWRTSQLGLHGMSTMPAILGVAALTGAWSLLRTPDRVRVGSDGLTIETKRGSQFRRWDDVGCAAVEAAGSSNRKRLNITDPDGKSIVKLDQSFERFDELAAMISAHIEAKGDGTAERILRNKATRRGALAFVVGLLMALASGFVAWTTHENQRVSRLLEERGESGEAEIIRRFVAPNGRTKRVEYKLVNSAGLTATRNVEVEPGFWDRLEGAKSIAVIWVPDEPSASRLALGEVQDNEFTKTRVGGYGLAALGGLLAVFLLVASPFLWNGWDLGHDATSMKWSLKRYGKVVWSTS
jgi:hypothetical protein